MIQRFDAIVVVRMRSLSKFAAVIVAPHIILLCVNMLIFVMVSSVLLAHVPL